MIKAFFLFACISAMLAFVYASGTVVATAAVPVTPVVVAAPVTTTTQATTATVAAAAVPIVCPAGCIPSQGQGGQSSAVSVTASLSTVLVGAGLIALL